MNTKEYIESGILELYVMGSLSACEMEEVATNIRKYPTLAVEVAAIEESLIAFSDENLEIELDDSILDNALKTIQSDKKETKVVSMPTNRVQQDTSISNDSKKTGNTNTLKLGLAAAFVGLMVSLGLNFMSNNNLQTAQDELASMQENQVDLENRLAELEGNNTNYQSQIAAITDPNNEIIIMAGVETQPDALATIYWNKASRETHISIANLPEAPEGMQYQLWALHDGVPIDAGVFDVTDDIQITKSIENADAFAVTLETAGGNPNPNLEMLYVIGNVNV